MKMVKSLLLGSMASLVAIASAQAADLPAKAEQVPFVKVTSVKAFYDGGTVFGKPIKGRKNVYIPMVMSIIVAEGSGLFLEGASLGLKAEGNGGIGSEEGGGPACLLKPAYLVSYGAGLGKQSPFHHVDYDHGA